MGERPPCHLQACRHPPLSYGVAYQVWLANANAAGTTYVFLVITPRKTEASEPLIITGLLLMQIARPGQHIGKSDPLSSEHPPFRTLPNLHRFFNPTSSTYHNSANLSSKHFKF